jgi:hypothetical protein
MLVVMAVVATLLNFLFLTLPGWIAHR